MGGGSTAGGGTGRLGPLLLVGSRVVALEDHPGVGLTQEVKHCRPGRGAGVEVCWGLGKSSGDVSAS